MLLRKWPFAASRRITWRTPRRPLSLRCLSFRCAFVHISAHIVFREGQIASFAGCILLLEKSEAQQRKLLHTNAMTSAKRDISADGKMRARSIRPDALKFEDT